MTYDELKADHARLTRLVIDLGRKLAEATGNGDAVVTTIPDGGTGWLIVLPPFEDEPETAPEAAQAVAAGPREHVHAMAMVAKLYGPHPEPCAAGCEHPECPTTDAPTVTQCNADTCDDVTCRAHWRGGGR